MIAAISQRIGKNQHGDIVDSLEKNYIDYLEKKGFTLILIPNGSKNINQLLKKVDYIILTGGNDINPALYSSAEEDSLVKIRDDTETLMIDFAIKNKIPVLGICRGMQFINVYFKGKIIEDIKLLYPEHKVRVDHEVITKEFGNGMTNSYHNQGINSSVLSTELKLFGEANGVIEALYHPTLPIAGIQWHPERNSPNDEFNDKIINAFIKKELFWK